MLAVENLIQPPLFGLKTSYAKDNQVLLRTNKINKIFVSSYYSYFLLILIILLLTYS